MHRYDRRDDVSRKTDTDQAGTDQSQHDVEVFQRAYVVDIEQRDTGQVEDDTPDRSLGGSFDHFALQFAPQVRFEFDDGRNDQTIPDTILSRDSNHQEPTRTSFRPTMS